jgi:hypothetical protein
MNSMKRVWVGILGGLSFCVLHAQEPPAHQAKFPKGDAAWEVKVEKTKGNLPEASPAQGGRQVSAISIVRMGNLRRDTTTWSDGTSTQTWWLAEPPLALLQGRNPGNIRALKVSQLGPRRFDESTFEWISAQNYKGEETIEGRKVKVYQLERPLDDGDVAILTAKLDAETGEPVVWSEGAKTVTFKFGQPLPGEPLVLPEDFRKALTRCEAYYAPAERRGKR